MLSSTALRDLPQIAQPASAQAGDVGELFQYAIATPVTLPRQQSAMLPIVNETVKGEKVSIYNEAVQAKHPLNGLRLINSTDLHLMQGPITVFDGGAYAGDAKIEDLPPGSRAADQLRPGPGHRSGPEAKSQPEQLLSVKLVKGTMHRQPQVRRDARVHGQELRREGQDRADRVPARRRTGSWSRRRSRPKRPATSTASPSRPSRASRPS